MSRLLTAFAALMSVAACTVLEVKEGRIPFEREDRVGNFRVHGAYLTLEVTRAAPPLTADDLTLAMTAASEYCTRQGKVMVMSEDQAPFQWPRDGGWILYAWCEEAS